MNNIAAVWDGISGPNVWTKSHSLVQFLCQDIGNIVGLKRCSLTRSIQRYHSIKFEIDYFGPKSQYREKVEKRESRPPRAFGASGRPAFPFFNFFPTLRFRAKT